MINPNFFAAYFAYLTGDIGAGGTAMLEHNGKNVAQRVHQTPNYVGHNVLWLPYGIIYVIEP
jgi:hypothetical protein